MDTTDERITNYIFFWILGVHCKHIAEQNMADLAGDNLPVIINILYKIIIYIYFFPQKICITKRASSIHFWSSKYKDGLSVVDVTFFILKQKTENVQKWLEQRIFITNSSK